jgi:subtilisin family serine protease
VSCSAAAPAPPPEPTAAIPPEGADDAARAAVAESDDRTAAGAIPLVTVEETSTGPKVTTTPVADAEQAAAVATVAAAGNDLVAVEADERVEALDHPGDPLRHSQWALDRVRFEDAWPTTKGNGVKVAVLDTGVKADHEDFQQQQQTQVTEGRVFTNLAPYPGTPGGTVDGNGHGTHVAGIIAAQDNNTKGIHGTAPAVQIVPVQVLESNGSGWSSDVANGIRWAVENGARVVNLSLGSSSPSSAQQTQIQYARNQGVLVVAAAGNQCQDGNPAQYPAAYPKVLAVGATTSTDAKAVYSSVGSYVDVAAPGDGVVSLFNDGAYATLSGTSMASPHAAAVAALAFASHPTWTGTNGDDLVLDRIKTTADDLGAPGCDDWFGCGLVDPVAGVAP